MKRFLEKMFNKSYSLNEKNILDFLDENSESKIIDLGCHDGEWTEKIANKVSTKNIYGLEIVEAAGKKAEAKGINVTIGDLANNLPFKDESFDIVHANQVIEHVPDIDKFVGEIHRVLRRGGYTIISTENGSSWHNIFAMIMGWQMFSLTNLSSKECGIGNPLALHRGHKDWAASWTHKVIFSYRGLKELFKVFGFDRIKIKGAGYYPLPAVIGKLDVRHSHFITIKAYKV